MTRAEHPRAEHPLAVQKVRVAIVGGGPAGLTAAAALARVVDGEVMVVEREDEVGGIPRHSHHTGYGLRDLRRVLTGPAYARRLADAAGSAGATVRVRSMVTGWGDSPDGATGQLLEITSPRGRHALHADAVVLATGARERPRAARLIPGDRGAGVLTTGQLQNLVYLHHREVGRRAVVIGAEAVSWSAVLTLRHAGCETVLMTSEFAQPESYQAFSLPGRLALGVLVARRTRVVRIIGSPRVRAVEIEHLDTGARRTVACDTVVTTADWIPDHELARLGGLTLDPGTRGPVVDAALRTSRPGVFAAGNVAHPVDTADVAALDGRHVADHVLRWLRDPTPAPAGVRLAVEPPLRWVAPQVIHPNSAGPSSAGPNSAGPNSAGLRPPRGRLLLWTDERVPRPVVRVVQDGRELARRRLPWPAAPGRVFRVPSDLVAGADPAGGPVLITLR